LVIATHDASDQVEDPSVRRESRGSTLDENASAVHHISPLRSAHPALHVLLNNEYPARIGGQRFDGTVNPVDHGGRKPSTWLVEQNKACVTHQRLSDREHLLLPTRQLLSRATASGMKVWEQPKYTIIASAYVRTFQFAYRVCPEFEILRNRHPSKDPVSLRNKRQAESRHF
jgi:hypothetical protein